MGARKPEGRDKESGRRPSRRKTVFLPFPPQPSRPCRWPPSSAQDIARSAWDGQSAAETRPAGDGGLTPGRGPRPSPRPSPSILFSFTSPPALPSRLPGGGEPCYSLLRISGGRLGSRRSAAPAVPIFATTAVREDRGSPRLGPASRPGPAREAAGRYRGGARVAAVPASTLRPPGFHTAKLGARVYPAKCFLFPLLIFNVLASPLGPRNGFPLFYSKQFLFYFIFFHLFCLPPRMGKPLGCPAPSCCPAPGPALCLRGAPRAPRPAPRRDKSKTLAERDKPSAPALSGTGHRR